jgi:hypothetical protein
MTRFSFSVALVFLFTSFSLSAAFAQDNTDRTQLESELLSLRAQIKVKETQFLTPARADREQFAEFLQQADTGLIRLLPREKFQDKLTTNGGGAYYSFARLTHNYGQGSDISLEQGQLRVGFAGADFGLLVTLGDVPLELVMGETEGVRFLTAFQTPTDEPLAREQYRRSSTGFQAEGFTYKSALTPTLNTTYALRSVSYERTDVLIAFRVIRQDSDGSVTLLWKLLKKFPTPHLVRDKTASM